jgi:hypothetical protein
MTGSVWLTAAMTLLAGFPHLDCRCPDGRVKPFCLDLTSQAGRCCCGGALYPSARGGKCCGCPRGASADAPGKAECCGRLPQGLRPGGPGGPAPQVKATGCSKALAQAEVFARSPARTKVSEVSPTALLVPSQVALVVASLSTLHDRISWDGDRSLPPDDLLTLLRHLLI